ncbi:ankyrin repeat domain-containing protein [Enterococcus sp. LJL98]
MENSTTLFEILQQTSQAKILTDLAAVKHWDVQVVNERGQSPLHLSVMNNQLAVTAYLLGKGFDPSQKDQTQLSPFIAAAANGFDQLFSLILAFSPELKQVNRFGGTALHPSAEKGFIRVVQKALLAGVPADEKNRLSWTPLLEAVILGNEGFLYRDLIIDLLNAQADPSMTDDFGLDAVSYANRLGHRNIAELLHQGERLDAFAEIRQLLREEKHPLALAKLSQMPSSLETTYYLGRTYEQLGEEENATYYYEQGLTTSLEFAYYLANLAKKQGNQEKARAYFIKGIQGAKQPTFYLYHFSNFLREIGQHEEALQVMDQLLEKDQQRVDYLFHKANSFRSLGQHQAAYEAMAQAHQLQPKNTLYSEHMAQSKELMEA